MATKRLPFAGSNKPIGGDTAAKANASMSAANNPFAWMVGFFLVAILVVAVLSSALIGSNVAANNSLLNQMQSRVTPPVNASCDGKAEERRTRAYQLRVNAAFDNYARRVECHERNNDETLYASQNYYASYSKSLPHDSLGHVNVSAYLLLLKAANSGLPSDWANVPLAVGAVKKLTNPLAGEAYSMEGADSHALHIPPAPSFSSAQHAADLVENYWMALMRDVPFANYSTHPLAAQAIAELNNMSDYRGLKPVTAQNLFRGVESGCTNGPMISQFLYLPCTFGATYIDQRITTYTAGVDFMTTFSEYLSIQNGQAPTAVHTFEPNPVFMRTGRDLARFCHMDVLYQGYFMAALSLLGMNAPLKPSLPYQGLSNSAPFGTFGHPFIMQLSANSAVSALKAAWFQKWNVHRRLRPEVAAARLDRHKRSLYTYNIHPELLNSAAASLINATYGGWLLPQAYVEGSPTHPSYAAGHGKLVLHFCFVFI